MPSESIATFATLMRNTMHNDVGFFEKFLGATTLAVSSPHDTRVIACFLAACIRQDPDSAMVSVVAYLRASRVAPVHVRLCLAASLGAADVPPPVRDELDRICVALSLSLDGPPGGLSESAVEQLAAYVSAARVGPVFFVRAQAVPAAWAPNEHSVATVLRKLDAGLLPDAALWRMPHLRVLTPLFAAYAQIARARH